MVEHQDGGPAFPRDTEGFDGPKRHHDGMTLRDYIATAAMQGAIAAKSDEEWSSGACFSDWTYRMADAQLKAREEASK